MCSTYIVDRMPAKYGGYQKAYQDEFKALVSWGARQIKEAPKDEKALVDLFFRMFDHFSEQRKRIALAHGTTGAEHFGIRRDLEGTKEFYLTVLDQGYSEYNKKILKVLAPHLRGMSLDRKETSHKIKKIEDLDSSLTIEILEQQELLDRKWLQTPIADECPSEFIAIEPLRDRVRAGKTLNLDERQRHKIGLKHLKEKTPAIYQQIKMLALFSQFMTEFPSPKVTPQPNGTYKIDGVEGNLKSIWVLATARVSVKGKMYATTQYLTWLYRDFKTHPVDRMLKYSTCMLIHQDNFLIADTLQEIARIFARVVLADDKKEFKTQVDLLRFYFAHNMPSERGSAAEGEMIKGSLYGARDLSIIYEPKYQIDLEALTSPLLSRFMRRSKKFLREEEVKQEER